MMAQLSPEASAVQSAIRRIGEFCTQWDANSRILSDPAIDPNTGKFHIAVKIGELVMLNSPSPVDAREILTLSNDELWGRLSHWSGERIKRPAA